MENLLHREEMPTKIQNYLERFEKYDSELDDDDTSAVKDSVERPDNRTFIRKPSLPEQELEEMHCEGMRGHFLKKKEDTIVCSKCDATWIVLE